MKYTSHYMFRTWMLSSEITLPEDREFCRGSVPKKLSLVRRRPFCSWSCTAVCVFGIVAECSLTVRFVLTAKTFGIPPLLPGRRCSFQAAIKFFIADCTTLMVVHETQNLVRLSPMLISITITGQVGLNSCNHSSMIHPNLVPQPLCSK